MAQKFGITEAQTGTATYLLQAVYAIGMLLMIPLGDKIEREKQIMTTSCFAFLGILWGQRLQFE